MTEAAATSYDEVPYGSHVFHDTHPDRLATMATLLGMKPPPVAAGRVLELGCGTGVNLASMALTLPQSRFVGLDLSPRQIATGQEVVQALGLTNIELKAQSLLEVDEQFGQFDYILCHGVYSWVPEEVQDRILTICGRNLAPDGVAYVSYNTYPGWHMRGMVREMMRFHVRQFAEATVRVEQARALLAFLQEAVGEREGAYAGILRTEAEMLQNTADAYLYHEHLEEINRPLYFHEFVARAAAKGLQYLAEVRPDVVPANLSPRVQETLAELATDLVHAEQYLDFVRNRTFRRTLLCHREVTLTRPPAPETVRDMQVTGLVKPVTAPDLAPGVPLEFRTAQGTGLVTRDPLLKAALAALFEVWPQAVPFAAVWTAVQSRLREALPAQQVPASDNPLPLAEALLQCYLSKMVELHVHAAQFSLTVAERPVASPLARLQVQRGDKITCLRHSVIELNEFERQLLALLDGSRDRAAVLDQLVAAVDRGDLELEQEGQPLRDLDHVRQLMSAALEPSLQRLARSALLL